MLYASAQSGQIRVLLGPDTGRTSWLSPLAGFSLPTRSSFASDGAWSRNVSTWACPRRTERNFRKREPCNGFVKKVGKHVRRRTVDDVDVSVLGVVSNEEIPNIDVAQALPTRGLAVPLHFDGTFIILVEDCLRDWVSLRFHEHFYVQSVWEVVACPN